MKRSKLWLFLLAITVIAVFAVIKMRGLGNDGKYDAFAKCLTDNGVKNYGAYWCPVCQAQEKMFGKSWKYVRHVECSLPDAAGQTSECNEAGITSYPVWEFKDGQRRGALTLEALSVLSGCELP